MLLIKIDERTIHNMDNGVTYTFTPPSEYRKTPYVEACGSNAHHEDHSYGTWVATGDGAVRFWERLLSEIESGDDLSLDYKLGERVTPWNSTTRVGQPAVIVQIDVESLDLPYLVHYEADGDNHDGDEWFGNSDLETALAPQPELETPRKFNDGDTVWVVGTGRSNLGTQVVIKGYFPDGYVEDTDGNSYRESELSAIPF